MGIIGVVAAMTMPALIANYQENVTITRLKKVYSVLSQLYVSVTQEEGYPNEWDVVYNDSGSRDGTMTFYNVLKNYTKYLKICNNYDCRVEYKLLSGSYNGDSSYRVGSLPMVLADGTFLRANFTDLGGANDCNLVRGSSDALKSVCAELYVDINGKQFPNTFGRDTFIFYWTKYGIVPVGTKEESSHITFGSTCSKNKSSLYSGYGCAAWVLVNENMDYMHCDDLSWWGKKTCK